MARVLIVDDSPTDTLAIYGMLKKYGHHFVFANGGTSGIAAAKAKKPDVILMDVVMPGGPQIRRPGQFLPDFQ